MNETTGAPPREEQEPFLKTGKFWSPYVLTSIHPHSPFAPVDSSSQVMKTSRKQPPFLHLQQGFLDFSKALCVQWWKVIGNPN